MVKVKVGATIPTVTYGNLLPEFEVEADSIEEGLAIIEPKLQELWNKYVEAGKELNTKNGNRKLIQCFVGGEIYYDDATHTYTNEAGEVYLSGSQYAKQFEKPFDAQRIAEAMAKKANVKTEDILAMWELNAEASKTFGTSLHAALELYGKYKDLSEALEKTSHIHSHPILKNAVESFYASHKEKSGYEVFVVDHATKRVGQIDRLEILGDKHCRVTDFKTNGDIEKSLPVYWKQLEFYTGIMEANGWKCEEPKIYHWNGNWKDLIKEEK